MIERREWIFNLAVNGDETRTECFELAETLDFLLPEMEVYAESVKSDLVMLRISEERSSDNDIAETSE